MVFTSEYSLKPQSPLKKQRTGNVTSPLTLNHDNGAVFTLLEPPPPMQKYCIVPPDKDTSEGWATLESKFSKHKVITSNIGRAGSQVILTIHGRCQTFYILQMDTVCWERWSSLSWEIHKASITLVCLTHAVCYGKTAHRWVQSSSVTAALCTARVERKMSSSLLLLKRSFKNFV